MYIPAMTIPVPIVNMGTEILFFTLISNVYCNTNLVPIYITYQLSMVSVELDAER